MIYLKNNTEKQTIFIPRNELQKEAFITTIRTYEDGLKEGYGNGIEDQKDQLLNLYVTENGTYEREDGYGKVTVVIGNDETAYEDGYKEGYEDGAASIQIDLENKSIDIVSNGEYTVTPTDGYDALESVKISVDVQNGGECNIQPDKFVQPQLSEIEEGYLYVLPDEGYNGMSRTVIQTANLREGWYNEGKAEGGNCNLEDKIIALQTNEVDGYGWIYVHPNEGYDGMKEVALQTNGLREVWYNEGYEEGRNVNVPSIDDYKYHILTAIGGVVDFGNVPFNGSILRQKAYNITTFWSDRVTEVIENGNLLPDVLVHSLIFGIEKIRAYSFQNMKYLTDITIRPFDIGDYAFANCYNLNRITLYGFSTILANYNISDTAFEGVADKGVVVLYSGGEIETWVRDVFMTKLPSEWTIEIIKSK